MSFEDAIDAPEVKVRSVCAVDGCGRFVQWRQWCCTHYARWLRTGIAGGAIKPLDGSPVVLDADKLKQVAVLLNGQNNGAMPSWKQLSDTDIAAVITYTKNNWSNKTGQIVQPAEVLAARK